MVTPWEIFRRCKWDIVTSMAGAYWNGIPATEIEAVARILAVDMTGELFDDVRDMQTAAAEVLNERGTHGNG